MVRPRWHDVLIVGSIMALLAAGVWALWWEDVRAYLDRGGPADDTVAPVPTGQT